MNVQDKYKFVRGRINEKDAKALFYDQALIRLSYLYEEDVKAIMYDGPVDIPIDVATHVVFLTRICPLCPHEFPGSDIALIKARLLADYGYLSAAPRFAYVMGILKQAKVLTPEEAQKCNVIMCEEVVDTTRKEREI